MDREPKPTVEWCLEHERHEEIPSCSPDLLNTEEFGPEREPEPVIVEFNDDALQALDFLMGLIHWDDLAKSMWLLLPDALQNELSQEFRSPEE